MSTSLRPLLTDALMERLSGRALEPHAAFVSPIAPVDSAGWPDVALLRSRAAGGSPGLTRLLSDTAR